MRKLTCAHLVVMALAVSACDNEENRPEAYNNWEADLPDYIDPEWASNPMWDDGRGEVAHYSAFMTLEGQQQNFEFVLITAKETFNKEFNVKTDDTEREDLFDVIKQNQFARVETASIPYNFLNSFYFKRKNTDLLHKVTYSSQEWCGNTFKEILRHDGGYTMRYNSYWDGQGKGEVEIAGNAWLEDQLPFTLRSLKFKDGLKFSRSVIPTTMSNKATVPTAYDAHFEVRLDQDLWEVKATLAEGKVSYYYFVVKHPFLMKQMVAHDGRRMLLTKAVRGKYWLAPVAVDRGY